MEAQKIRRLGYKNVKESKTSVNFEHNGYPIVFWKKSKWFSGKSIEDGRGIDNLISQLKSKEPKIINSYTNNDECYNHLIGIFQKHIGQKLKPEFKEKIIEEMKQRFTVNLLKS